MEDRVFRHFVFSGLLCSGPFLMGSFGRQNRTEELSFISSGVRTVGTGIHHPSSLPPPTVTEVKFFQVSGYFLKFFRVRVRLVIEILSQLTFPSS